MDILDSCNICGEGHTTELCPELGLNTSSIQFDQLSTRARLTLPSTLEVVDNGSGLVGVVAKETIPFKTQLGPYEAKRTTHIFEDEGFFTLKLISKDGSTVCLDTTDENECNWMCLVRAALTRETQNCMAYQLGANIFYNTTRDIQEGEELQVWYTPNFAKKLNKPTHPDGITRVLLGHRIEPLQQDAVTDTDGLSEQTDDQEVEEVSSQSGKMAAIVMKAYYCPRCGNTFNNQTDMVQHLRGHVLGIMPKPAKPRRGRPRKHQVIGTPTQKRGRGRPRKSQSKNIGHGYEMMDQNEKLELNQSVVNTYERKRTFDRVDNHDDDGNDNIEPMSEQYDVPESDEDEELVERKLKIEIDETDNDFDVDYNPQKEVSLSSVRVQPRRSRKGKHSKFEGDYVVGRVGRHRESGSDSVSEDVLVGSATEKSASKGRGRPKKMKLDSENVGDTESVVGTDSGSSVHVDSVLVPESDMGTDSKSSVVANSSEENDAYNESNVIQENDQNNGVIDQDSITDIREATVINKEDEDKPDQGQSIDTKEVEKEKEANDVELTEKASQGNDLEGSRESTVEVMNKTVVMFEESKDMYCCVLCDDKFTQEIDAIAHFMNHSKGSGKCKKCKKATTNSQDVTSADKVCSCSEAQASAEGKSEEFVCDICQQAFKNAQYLYRHMVMHTDIFSCIRCKKTFSRKDSMQKHVLKCCPNLIDEYKFYACDLCSRVFSKLSGKNNHMKNCKSVKCNECSKVFTSKSDLSSHKCRKGFNDDAGSGKYSCGICPKSFQSLYYLKQHRMLHEKLHSCEHCGKSLASKDELEQHQTLCQTLEKIKTLGIGKCDKCLMDFNSCKQFREHYLSHSHPYQCEKCLRRFVKVGTLTSHDCQVSSQEFICPVCKRVFKSQLNLERHTKEHGCWKYECSTCNQQFSSKTLANDHVCDATLDDTDEKRVIIQLETKEVCPTCGKSFSNRSNLTKHMLLHGEKNFPCPHCEKRFHLDVYLKEHITCVHFNIYKYQCTECGKMLKSKTGLLAHTKLFHTKDIEMVKCPKCEKTFKQKGNLRVHMYSHSNERNFKCDVCEKCFKYPDQLSRHKLEHKVLNKLNCDHCEKQFCREFELKKHMQTYHSGYIYVCAECSARCGHRHTLVRHYKRKHQLECYLLSREGYLDGMLKHVNDIFDSAPDQLNGEYKLEEVAVHSNQNSEQVTNDAAEALHSLALGTVTTKQYQLLKEKGLFKDEMIPVDQDSPQHVALAGETSVIMSQDGEVLQEEQMAQADGNTVTNMAAVSMEGTIGMIHNADGTISINGIQGIPQTLDALETAEGQIVILQIVDPESQEQITGEIMQGTVIQEYQGGEVITEGQDQGLEEGAGLQTTQIIQSQDLQLIEAEKGELNPAEVQDGSAVPTSDSGGLQQGEIMEQLETNVIHIEQCFDT